MIEHVKTRQIASWGGVTHMVVVFLILLGTLNGLYQIERRYAGYLLDLPYSDLVAIASAHLGNLILPFDISHKGLLTLGTEHVTILVKGGCNGLEAIFLMIAGVLAFPSPWKQRFQGLGIYLPALFILNLFRVVMLVYVMVCYPEHANFFHLQIGQGFLVIFVLAFWMHYVRWSTQ